MTMLPLIDNSILRLLLLAIGLLVIAYGLRSSLLYWYENLREQKNLVDRINSLLPQTQCGQCGYEGCRPYARAIAQGTAINQCPPGGDATIQRLAQLLNDYPRALNPAHGEATHAVVAFIREDECIGCTKCIQACPVDAILGGARLMHTVIASECTGCDLCVDPCPVDCIDMLPVTMTNSWRWNLPTEVRKEVRKELRKPITTPPSRLDSYPESRA